MIFKTALLISLAAHILVIYFAPAARETARPDGYTGLNISYIGAMPGDFMVFPRESGKPSASPERSHFYPPEAELVLFEPPEIEFEPDWEPPEPEIPAELMPAVSPFEGEDCFLERELSVYSKEANPAGNGD